MPPMPDPGAYVRDIVAAACRLPIDYYLLGNLGASELLRRSGYPSVRSQFDVDMVVDCLADHDDWVDAWFHWSEDTRGTPAWFIQERDGQYIVGYYDGRPTKAASGIHRSGSCVCRVRPSDIGADGLAQTASLIDLPPRRHQIDTRVA